MFKKLLSGLLALTLCLSVAGCSESDSSSKSADDSTSSDSSSAAEPSADSSETDPDESEESSQPDSSSEASSDPEPDDGKEPSDITPAMWKVTGENGGTVYFLGSMHALTEDCYPLPDEIMDAYNSSDSLAVECDIFDYQNDMDAQMDLVIGMMYSDGTTISDHIDADLYESAKQLLSDAGMYSPFYDYYNVILWQSLIEIAMLEETGIDSTYGIDMNLLTMAHEEGKNIIEIESVEMQSEILYGQPDEFNQFMLETYVYYFEDQCDELLISYEKWCDGTLGEYMESEEEIDPEEYEEIEITEELEAMIDSYNKQLLDDRNVGMAQKAIEMIENGENVFYVVGAAHFYGETGIIKLLEDAGYIMEPVEYK